MAQATQNNTPKQHLRQRSDQHKQSLRIDLLKLSAKAHFVLTGISLSPRSCGMSISTSFGQLSLERKPHNERSLSEKTQKITSNLSRFPQKIASKRAWSLSYSRSSKVSGESLQGDNTQKQRLQKRSTCSSIAERACSKMGEKAG